MIKTILTVLGTRPEVIKMAKLIELFNNDTNFHHIVCVTGQHKELLYQALNIFNIKPDIDLQVMIPNQTLEDITAKIIISFTETLKQVKPDLVLVHGDTTTSFACALSAFYQQIPVGHVEAGLRTHNKNSPFPEEMNRTITAQIASLHFAPTELNRKNLLKEGISDKNIFVTGNTVIDTLLSVANKLTECPDDLKKLDEVINGQFILVTGHRRENFGQGFDNICLALQILAKKFIGCHIIYPVHLNPNVKNVVHHQMQGFNNVHLIEPLDYFSFIYLMKKCTLILTDSGGIQEEAPSLQKPVLVMREYTERTEALESNTIQLVGTNVKNIVDSASAILTASSGALSIINPYGDGRACQRIVNHLHARLI
jgi:UDP-N-acetylglucosamine 2-epimerase (non-hydrolysing)